MRKHIKKLIVFITNAAIVLSGVFLINNYEKKNNAQTVADFSDAESENSMPSQYNATVNENNIQTENSNFINEPSTPTSSAAAQIVPTIPAPVPNNGSQVSPSPTKQTKKTKPKTRTS